MYKYLVSLTLFLSVAAHAALSNEDCAMVASNIHDAQVILNQDKPAFDEVTSQIEATPAARFGVSEEVKAYVLQAAKTLKEGTNPDVAMKASWEACKATQKQI